MAAEATRTKATMAALAGLAALACVCGPSQQPPPTDTCSKAENGQVSAVVVASSRVDGRDFGTGAAHDELPPRPLVDGSMLWEVQGGQGASMVPLRLLYFGAAPPSCAAQDTQITSGSSVLGRSRDNVATYAFDAGVRATKTIWLPGAYDGQSTLAVDTGGLKLSLGVNISPTWGCRARGLCPCSEQSYADTAEGLTDAGAALWSALRACRLACDAGSCCQVEQQACDADLF